MNIAVCDDNPKIVGQIEKLLFAFLKMIQTSSTTKHFYPVNPC